MKNFKIYYRLNNSLNSLIIKQDDSDLQLKILFKKVCDILYNNSNCQLIILHYFNGQTFLRVLLSVKEI